MGPEGVKPANLEGVENREKGEITKCHHTHGYAPLAAISGKLFVQ
jgi:hypothetical protein